MNNKFRYLPGTYVVSSMLPDNLKSYSKDFDILYYCHDDMIFNRIWRSGEKYLYEIPGDLSEVECKYYFDEMNISIEKHSIRRINFIFSEKIKSIKDITFLGRLACWNADEFISDSIKKSSTYRAK
jgi:hypothetical protein